MRFKVGFSLMEMMVVLLVFAVAAAAMTPLVSKSKLGAASEAEPWRWMKSDGSISYNEFKVNQTATIGAINPPASSMFDPAIGAASPRLFIDSADGLVPQIALGATKVTDAIMKIYYAKDSLWMSTHKVKIEDSSKKSVVFGGGVSVKDDAKLPSSLTFVGSQSEIDSNAVGAVGVGAGINLTGSASTAIGASSEVIGPSSVSIGYGSKANASNTVAIGYSAIATSYESGDSSVLEGLLGALFGDSRTDSSGANSVAIGYEAVTTAEDSVAIGYGAHALAGELAGGVTGYAANITYGVPTGFASMPNISDFLPNLDDYLPNSGNYLPDFDDYQVDLDDYLPDWDDYDYSNWDEYWDDYNQAWDDYWDDWDSSFDDYWSDWDDDFDDYWEEYDEGWNDYWDDYDSAWDEYDQAWDEYWDDLWNGSGTGDSNSQVEEENLNNIKGSSIAIGYKAKTLSPAAYAIGSGAQASERAAIAIGGGASAKGKKSLAIGVGAENAEEGGLTLGTSDATLYIPGILSVAGNVYLNVDSGYTAIRTSASGLKRIDSISFSASDSMYYHDDEWNWQWVNYDINVSNSCFALVESVSPSDRNLKNISQSFNEGLKTIKNLVVYNYTFIKDKLKTPRVGVLAQDLQKIYPHAVTEGKDGFLRIRLEDMFYTLVNAVKDLDNKISEIKNIEITVLKGRFDDIDTKSRQIKKNNESISKRLVELERKIN